jgi:hypothetical protein
MSMRGAVLKPDSLDDYLLDWQGYRLRNCRL